MFLIFGNIHTTRGGLGIKIDFEETENTDQFWANNKIFINCRPKFLPGPVRIVYSPH